MGRAPSPNSPPTNTPLDTVELQAGKRPQQRFKRKEFELRTRLAKVIDAAGLPISQPSQTLQDVLGNFHCRAAAALKSL